MAQTTRNSDAGSGRNKIGDALIAISLWSWPVLISTILMADLVVSVMTQIQATKFYVRCVTRKGTGKRKFPGFSRPSREGK